MRNKKDPHACRSLGGAAPQGGRFLSWERPGDKKPVMAAVAMALFGLLGATAVQAAGYPERMVRIVVPYPPGGFNDTLGRLVAAKLQEKWKQNVVVENKPGAGTIIGTSQVARAAADGYTLLVNQFPFAANPYLYKSLPYDTRKDFTPIVLAGRSPMVLVTHVDTPFKSTADVLDAARRDPKGLTYGTSGPGSSNHLAMALFESLAKVEMTQVPYRGSTPLLTDLAGGQVKLAFDAFPHVLPFLQSGKVRALALASEERSSLMPDLPTVIEAGVPGYVTSSWHGFMAPTGTPQAVLDKLNRDINEVLEMPDVRNTFREQGVVPDGGSAQDFSAFIDQQMALWKKVAADANVELQ